MGVANETFEAQKVEKLLTLPGRGSSDFSDFTQEMVLTLLLALCHLVAEDKPRKIVMGMKLHETMHTYLAYHWSIFDSFKSWLQQQVPSLWVLFHH